MFTGIHPQTGSDTLYVQGGHNVQDQVIRCYPVIPVISQGAEMGAFRPQGSPDLSGSPDLTGLSRFHPKEDLEISGVFLVLFGFHVIFRISGISGVSRKSGDFGTSSDVTTCDVMV